MAFNGVSSLMALLLLEPRLGVVSEVDTVEMQGRKSWSMGVGLRSNTCIDSNGCADDFISKS